MTYFLKQTVNFLITACKEWLLFLKKLIIVIFELFKKIDDKLNKNSSLLGIIFLIMLVVVVPIYAKSIINIIFHGDKLDSWLSFYGSYLGGILGGAATLAAVIRTTNQAKLMQEENKKETRKIQDENKKLQLQHDRKVFVDDIALIVSKFLVDINDYFWNFYFMDEKAYKEYKKDKRNDINRKKAAEMYYLINIKLDNIVLAKNLLDEMNMMYNKYCFVDYTDDKDIKIKKKDIFEKCSQNIKTKTKEFIRKYLSEEL